MQKYLGNSTYSTNTSIVRITFFSFRSTPRGVTKQPSTFFFFILLFFLLTCVSIHLNDSFSFFSLQEEQTCYFIFLLRHLPATCALTKSSYSFLDRNRKKQHYSFYLCNYKSISKKKQVRSGNAAPSRSTDHL